MKNLEAFEKKYLEKIKETKKFQILILEIH